MKRKQLLNEQLEDDAYREGLLGKDSDLPVPRKSEDELKTAQTQLEWQSFAEGHPEMRWRWQWTQKKGHKDED